MKVTKSTHKVWQSMVVTFEVSRGEITRVTRNTLKCLKIFLYDIINIFECGKLKIL